MNELAKEVIAESIAKRLALSGHPDKEQARVWAEAVMAILEGTEEEKISGYPKNGQSNFRRMITLCHKFFSLEIAAYKKYNSDRKKGIEPADAAARMATRLEHQQQPVDFS